MIATARKLEQFLHRLWVSAEGLRTVRNSDRRALPRLSKVKTFCERKAKPRSPSFGDCVNRLAHFHRKMEEGSKIRWQHRLKRDTQLAPSEQKSLIESADGRVATVGHSAGEKKLFDEETQELT